MRYINYLFFFFSFVLYSQTIVTLDGGTKVLDISSNNLNSYLDAFFQTSYTLGYDLSELKNRNVSIRFLSINEERPKLNNYHDKNSFFAIAFALGMKNDNKIEIVVDYEQWLRLDDLQKSSVMFHELCHDILNAEHDDSNSSNLMHSSKGPKTIDALLKDFNAILSKYALKYKIKTSIHYGDSYSEFVRINPMGGKIQKDYKNNLLAGTTKKGLNWVAFFNKNNEFEKFVIVNGIYDKEGVKENYDQIKSSMVKRYGQSETMLYEGDVWFTEWQVKNQKIEYFTQPYEKVILIRTIYTGLKNTRLTF